MAGMASNLATVNNHISSIVHASSRIAAGRLDGANNGTWAYGQPAVAAVKSYMEVISGLQRQLAIINGDWQGIVMSATRLVPIVQLRLKRQTTGLATGTSPLHSLLATLRSFAGQVGDVSDQLQKAALSRQVTEVKQANERQVIVGVIDPSSGRPNRRPQVTRQPESGRRPNRQSTTALPDDDDFDDVATNSDIDYNDGGGRKPTNSKPTVKPNNNGRKPTNRPSNGRRPVSTVATTLPPPAAGHLEEGQGSGDGGSDGDSGKGENPIERLVGPLQKSINTVIGMLTRMAGSPLGR